MRIFLTSYQKTGTHQAYPMFMPDCPHIKDYGHVQHIGMAEFINRQNPGGPNSGYTETVAKLRAFGPRAFGHIPYLFEYADAMQAQPTKVVFNVRDPRDVIVSELETIRKHMNKGTPQHAWHNYKRFSDEKRVMERDSPISELIYIASIKWKNWLGWLKHDWVIPVKFEDLRLNPQPTVDKLVVELEGYPLPKSARQMVVSMERGRRPGQEVPTFRKGLVGEWRRYFTAEEEKLAANWLGEIMERLGYG
jgi:hypothetical protein